MRGKHSLDDLIWSKSQWLTALVGWVELGAINECSRIVAVCVYLCVCVFVCLFVNMIVWFFRIWVHNTKIQRGHNIIDVVYPIKKGKAYHSQGELMVGVLPSAGGKESSILIFLQHVREIVFDANGPAQHPININTTKRTIAWTDFFVEQSTRKSYHAFLFPLRLKVCKPCIIRIIIIIRTIGIICLWIQSAQQKVGFRISWQYMRNIFMTSLTFGGSSRKDRAKGEESAEKR